MIDFSPFYPPRAWGYDNKLHLENLSYAEWRRVYMRHARHLGTHTKDEWATLRDGAPGCAHCGLTDDKTKDHILPVSIGGCDCIHNIQVLCHSCNAAKGNR
jgi:5-methylcytosine-specific restriction endonuclease McrA